VVVPFIILKGLEDDLHFVEIQIHAISKVHTPYKH
jgi:hypothetical protein